jgi:hypothetical protein
MPGTRIIVAAIALQSVAIVGPVAADVVLAVANASFERGAPSPEGWSVAAPRTTTVRRSGEAFHSGAASLLVASPAPASVTVTSEPLALEIGRLYRLSGWIRTEGVSSDPGARYPTALPAALTMESFPFTNHSPAVGASADWTRVETLFIATRSRDRVRAHLGLNGTATGRAWFDDLAVDAVDDITALIPWETVRWSGEGYRYDDRGWIFVHIEGAPYARGRQFGELVAAEIAEYIRKLSVAQSAKDPAAGWNALRLLADATMLRGYDEEFLTEMKGIADGAAGAGATVDGRPVDLLDVVTINSAIDLGQLRSGLRVTPHALSGRTFLSPQEAETFTERTHKCSSFAATGPATADGRVVFGQIFMWSGYTGVHFNVLLDVQPEKGHRLVYQTFPGGIHSGTDFYINSAGIVIGETTVAQTPYEPSGTPQSNRIRKAAQYAASIDDVVRILREKNNGMYTNDWPIADVKTDEVAVYLLGTHRDRLWRSTDTPAPFGTPGFLWANNNARDPGVRSEYVANPDNAPHDLAFTPWDRDVAFNRFYREFKGRIDSIAGVNLWASSPINRAHACDGKITTSEMAEKLVFLAHYGKVTLREKFPTAGSRRMPDLPGAIPHLSLGYSTASPIFVTDALKAARAARAVTGPRGTDPALDAAAVEEIVSIEKKRLWRNTVFPASDAEGWLVSGDAAIWQMLDAMPDDRVKAAGWLRDQLAEQNARLLATLATEEDVAPVNARVVYDRFAPYRVSRIKGTFLFHQLRLLLGNESFLAVMHAVHDRYAGRALDIDGFIRLAGEKARRDLGPFVRQWIERTGLPDPSPSATVEKGEKGWTLRLEVDQTAEPYHFVTTVAVDAGGTRHLRPVEIHGPHAVVALAFDDRPTRLEFNAGNDIPVGKVRFHTWASYVDDFANALIVHGTSRQDEANRTLALRFQTTLADAYAETLSPVVKDCEVSDEDLASHDLIVLGGPSENTVAARLAGSLPVAIGANHFRWRGRTYAEPGDGLFLVVPNPRNARRVLYLFVANSALQLHDMTREHIPSLPSWAVFKGAEPKERGYHEVERFVIDLPAS